MKTPDLYILLDITVNTNTIGVPEGTTTKVFSTWYGGYAGTDEWRLNSGITKVEIVDGIYQIYGNTDTIYQVANNIGTSAWTQSVLDGMIGNLPTYATVKVLNTRDDVVSKLQSFISD